MDYEITSSSSKTHFDDKLNQELLISDIISTIDNSILELLKEISDNLLMLELNHLYINKIYNSQFKFRVSETIDTVANITNRIVVQHYDLIKKALRLEIGLCLCKCVNSKIGP